MRAKLIHAARIAGNVVIAGLLLVGLILYVVAMVLRLLLIPVLGVGGGWSMLIGVRMLISGDGRGWWLLGGGVVALAIMGALIPRGEDGPRSGPRPGGSVGFGAGN